MKLNKDINEDTKKKEVSNVDLDKLQQLPIEIYKEQNPDSFPFWVFPKEIQNIVIETNKCLNFPIDFISPSLFWTCGLAIGNSRSVSLNGSKISKANLWIVIVAHRGIGKSAPLGWAMKPIELLEAKYYSEYQTAYNGWKNTTPDLRGEPPLRKKLILDDFTMEVLGKTHSVNRRATGVYNDELIGWIKSLQENNSKFKHKWLSLWNGGKLDVVRMSREENFLPTTFIPVIGTTQPSKLSQFLTTENIDDGLADRILFVNAEHEENKSFSKIEFPENVKESWFNIVNQILDIELEFDEYDNPKPINIPYNPLAKEYLMNWQEKTVDFRNRKIKENPIVNDYLRAYAKHDDYVQRFALIIQVMDDICSGRQSHDISLESIKGAIEISNYFMRHFKSIFHKVKGFGIESVGKKHKKLYESLPTSKCFTISEAVCKGESLNMSKSTVKRALNNISLYGKEGVNNYYKI